MIVEILFAIPLSIAIFWSWGQKQKVRNEQSRAQHNGREWQWLVKQEQENILGTWVAGEDWVPVDYHARFIK